MSYDTPLHFVMDHREPASIRDYFARGEQFARAPVSKHVVVEECALDVGDFLVQDSARNTLLYVERKTLDDLRASIRDGRHRNQKFRLLEACEGDPARVLYLYEGAVRGKPASWYGSGGSMRVVVGAQCNTMFRDGIRVWRTAGIEETIVFLETLLRKMATEPWMHTGAVESSGSYAHTLQANGAKKSRRCAPRDMYVCFLEQVPGMSFARAEVVAGAFPSLSALASEAAASPTEATKRVAALRVGGRRLGDKVASRIIDSVICGEGEPFRCPM